MQRRRDCQSRTVYVNERITLALTKRREELQVKWIAGAESLCIPQKVAIVARIRAKAF